MRLLRQACTQNEASTVTAPRRVEFGSTYTGAEMRPFDGRQGAMRAFTLPSLQNGQSVERVRPQLFGTSKPERRQ